VKVGETIEGLGILGKPRITWVGGGFLSPGALFETAPVGRIARCRTKQKFRRKADFCLPNIIVFKGDSVCPITCSHI